MTLSSVLVVPSRSYFPELSLRLEESDAKILTLIEKLKTTSWHHFSIEGKSIEIDKTYIKMNLELCVLESLRTDPLSTLSFQEEKDLLKAKMFEKQTQFFLSYQGALILSLAAVLSGISGGAGYYYGVKAPAIDPLQLAILFGIASLVGALASNLLGFYITGSLPHNASNANNIEQNIWEKFAICKIQPAAYQLLQWYSPKKGVLETDEAFKARRMLALAYLRTLKLDEIVSTFKASSTQKEKVEAAFSSLYEAMSLITMQLRYAKGSRHLSPISGPLSFVAKQLGYFAD